MTSARLLIGDVDDALELVADGSVSCAVTSIPYFGLRSYTDDGREIGKGSLERYLNDVVGTFAALAPKLTDGGLCWINVGDTANESGGAGGDYRPNQRRSKSTTRKYKQGETGLKGKQWLDVPGRLAHALQGDGWLLRSPITWNKGPGGMRREQASHVRRPRPQSERILMLARSKRYVYRWESEVEPGDVWTFDVARGKGNGPAPFPLELPARCIALSEPGLVLDVFVGSGTSMLAARNAGQDAVGVDINPEMIPLVRAKVGGDVDVYSLTDRAAA